MNCDISSYFGVISDLDLLCLEDAAILNGFINLINTNKDIDGISERPFRPNLGTNLLTLLQDPIDNITAFQIKLQLMDLGSQISRAFIVSEETLIVANTQDECFNITLVLRNKITGGQITGYFTLTT
jgi:hypothetical protein